MKKKISVVQYVKLKQQEFPQVVNEVIAIVEKNDPVAKDIDRILKNLIGFKPQLTVLTEKRFAHPLTKVLQTQYKRRNELSSGIVLQALGAEKAGLPSQLNAVTVLVPVIKRHLLYLGRENTKEINQRIDNFLLEVNSSEILKSAATTLSLSSNMEELGTLQKAIAQNITSRNETKAPVRSINQKKLKADIIDALQRLINAIEVARVEHPTVDYSTLINELNEFFVPYQALIRGRSTRQQTANQKSAVNNKPTTDPNNLPG